MYRYSLIVVLLAAVSLKAQEKGVSIGARAGTVLSNCSITYTSPGNYTQHVKASVLIGVFAHIPAGKNFAFRPTLDFVNIGTKRRDDYGSYAFNLNYLDLAANMMYEAKTNNGKLLAGGGPMIGYHLNKKIFTDLSDIDAGFNILTAYEWPIGFSINLNYRQGLKNVASSNTYFKTLRNYYVGISLGYLF